MVLVVLVIVIFLQTWRAAIIPIIAIPVSLIGTFAVQLALGFSINTLSLFALVLAVGIVVDDAIVVVEAVERHIREGLSPRDAAHRTMQEISGALIAIGLVLVAVFVPAALISGIPGIFYRQFAVTIAAAAVDLDARVADPVAGARRDPAEAAPDGGGRMSGRRWLRPLRAAGDRFNQGFDWLSEPLRPADRQARPSLDDHAGHLWRPARPDRLAAERDADRLHPGSGPGLPDRRRPAAARRRPRPDRGGGRPDPGGRLAKSDGARNGGLRRPRRLDLQPGLEQRHHVPSPRRRTRSGAATARRRPSWPASSPARSARREEGAQVFFLSPPPVPGLGNGSGFAMMLQDREGAGYQALQGATFAMMGAAQQNPNVGQVFSLFNTGTPRIEAEVDRDRAQLLGVQPTQVYQALGTYLGSTYVNDFNLLGRTFRVTAQAEATARDDLADVGRLQVRSSTGAMVPLSAVATFRYGSGPVQVTRYNNYPAAELQGQTPPGVASGDSLRAMEELAAQTLPPGFAYEWTGLAYQQQQAGNTAPIIFAIAVLCVFLVLAAQYESLTLPLAVILIVPMCILAAMTGINLRGLDNNILTQVGLIVLVALAAKNAILIVEFARQGEEEHGMDPFEAAVHAARSRLRPILMTSFAFIFGVIPLVIAVGPGAEMRQAMGTAVAFGMLGVTLFGLIFTPVFYVVCRRLGGLLPKRPQRDSIIRPRSAACPTSRRRSRRNEARARRPRRRARARRLRGRPGPSRSAARRAGAGAVRLRRLARLHRRRAAGALVEPVPRSAARLAGRGGAPRQHRSARRRRQPAPRPRRASRNPRRAAAEHRNLGERDLRPGAGRRCRRPLRRRHRHRLSGRSVRPHHAAPSRRAAPTPKRCRRRSTSPASPSPPRPRALMPTPAAPAASSPSRARRCASRSRPSISPAVCSRAAAAPRSRPARPASLLDQNRAAIPTLEALRRTALFRLSVLTGRPPADFPRRGRRLRDAAGAGRADPGRRRRRAARAAAPTSAPPSASLAAATARVGVATADLYPNITPRLLGRLDFAVARRAGLGRRLSLQPRAAHLLDLPQHRRRRASRIAQAEASARRRAGDVRRHLAARARGDRERAHPLCRASSTGWRPLRRARAQSAEAARIARLRYQAGREPFQIVLDAERALAQTDAAVAQSEALLSDNLVSLFLALGGGWQDGSGVPRSHPGESRGP